MRRLLLASHGPLARAMKETLELLTGPDDRITSLCAYVGEDSMDVALLIDSWEHGCKPDDDWLVVTDILGGSVNNEFLIRMGRMPFHLIAGMNLPLLVELVTCSNSADDDSLADVVHRANGSITICSAPSAAIDNEDDDF